MKRLVYLVLVLVLAMGVVGCKDKEPVEKVVEADVKIVEVTLPAYFNEGVDFENFDFDSYIEQNGFETAVLNDDGSFTVTMKEDKHAEVVAELLVETDEYFAQIKSDFDYITEITYEEGLKAIEVKVDKAIFEAAAYNMTASIVGMQANFYQTFALDEVYVVVDIVDKDTGEIIVTEVFPEPVVVDEPVDDNEATTDSGVEADAGELDVEKPAVE